MGARIWQLAGLVGSKNNPGCYLPHIQSQLYRLISGRPGVVSRLYDSLREALALYRQRMSGSVKVARHGYIIRGLPAQKWLAAAGPRQNQNTAF